MFGPVSTASSVSWNVNTDGLPRAKPPVGFDSTTDALSGPSDFESSLMSTVIVFSDSPGPNRRVQSAVV